MIPRKSDRFDGNYSEDFQSTLGQKRSCKGWICIFDQKSSKSSFKVVSTLKRPLVYFSDNLQSNSVKNSGQSLPQIRKVLTETTLKTFSASAEEYPGPRKHCHGPGSIKSIENPGAVFQGVNHLEKTFCMRFRSNSYFRTR